MATAQQLDDYEEFLDRFDIDIEEVENWEKMRELVKSKWMHKYDMTADQLAALETAYLDAKPVETPAPANQYYQVTGTGKIIPKLASRGIRRISYGVGSGRQTRYSVPGYRGLFGLARARELFRTL